MTDLHTLAALDAIADYADGVAKDLDEEHDRDPYGLFSELLPSAPDIGLVQALDTEPRTHAASRRDIYESTDSFPRSYGIDASLSPNTFKFTNGMVMNVARAVLGVNGGDTSLSKHQMLTASFAYKDGRNAYDSTLVFDDAYDLHGDTVTIKAEATRVPMFEQVDSRIEDWVQTYARTRAESKHLKNRITDIDGALFLDGPLYPPSILSRLNYARSSTAQPPRDWGKCVDVLIQNYIDVIEQQLKNGYPVVGVSKTVRTNDIVRTLKRKSDYLAEDIYLPWGNDYAFMSDLLRHGDNTAYTYTSWLVKEKDIQNGVDIEPLDGFRFEYTSPEELRRAYFFMRFPGANGGFVMRIETPLCYIKNATPEARHDFQKAILREFAETEDIPRAVKQADADAALPQEYHDKITQSITSADMSSDYNEDGRWKDLDFTNDNPTAN